jgi:flagellar biosynthesis protein
MTDDPREKRRRAVAMRYKAHEDPAPKVVAKGAGLIADRILEIAREHGVHVHEDPDLVEVLSKLELDQEIPPDLYKAVAEVLAFVYRINQRAGANRRDKPNA